MSCCIDIFFNSTWVLQEYQREPRHKSVTHNQKCVCYKLAKATHALHGPFDEFIDSRNYFEFMDAEPFVPVSIRN